MLFGAPRRAAWRLRNLPLYAKGLAVVALPLAWLLVVAIAFYLVQRENQSAGSWVRHTQEVRSQIQLVHTRVEEAQTGALGYRLTHDSAWLAPYQRAQQSLPGILDRLEAMVGDNPRQAARVRRIRSLVTEQLKDLHPLTGANPALAESGNTLAAVRQILNDTMKQEDDLLAARRATARATQANAYAVIVAGVLLVPFCGVLAMLLFTSAVARRIEVLDANSHRLAEGLPIVAMRSGNDEIGRLEQSLSEAASLLARREAELRRSSEEMEARVAERTSELAVANRALEAEVAERNRAEQELADLNRRLEAVIDASPLAIIRLDLQGNVQAWSRAAEQLFGWREEEVLGKPLPTVPNEESEEFQALIDRTAHGEVLTGYTTRRRRKDESLVDIRLWTAPLFSSSGEVRGKIAIVADITDQMRLEQQLNHSLKMEAMGRLAGGVAHDFNNVITVVSGYGHMILDSVQNDPDLREAAEEVLKAASRAAALANQLLTFSRHQAIQPTVLEINALVRDMERMLGRVIGEQIDLQVVVSPAVGAVRADVGQLEQVLMNLVVNARDAMPGGGTLTLETANVVLDENYSRSHSGVGPGNYVMLAVSDTGSGMDAETRSHIFEPFFTTKERGKGTGLGLSIVYGIIKQHGGDIWVYSEPEKGTTFKIYLPQVAAASAAGEAGNPVVRRLSGDETVLLVEDEPGVRKLVRGILEQYGYSVIEAESGRQALEMETAHEGRIDLLLADVVLPEMSGRDVADALVLSRPGIKVLYLSGYTDHVVIDRGVLAAGACFLQKPFTPEVLAGKIREVLDDRTQAA
jgi:PAS domain S-box-containing protein